jgi:hypothetical protein
VRKGIATNRVTTAVGTVLGIGALALGIVGMMIVFRAVDDLSDRLQVPSAAPALEPGAAAATPDAGAGAPPIAAAPTASELTFTVAFSLPGGTGELQIEVSPDFSAEEAYFVGRV